MNLVIFNENITVYNNLYIDIIKSLYGSYALNDLKEELVNFYFNKVIIDITAIKNYFMPFSLFEFLSYFEKDKVILVLYENDYCNSKEFLTKLIEKGYYNFTKNAQGVAFLISKSNTYDDVKKYLIKDSFSSALNQGVTTKMQEERKRNLRVIGIQNITPGAGATTLMHMMVKQLNLNYKVKGFEVNKHDSLYFRSENLIYCTSILDADNNLNYYPKCDAIIVDLNGENRANICDEILYLLEPGIVRLNECLRDNPNLVNELKGKKVILNKSGLKEEDISNFERETGIDVFFNLGCINDRADRLMSVDRLLVKLGFEKQEVKRGIFTNI